MRYPAAIPAIAITAGIAAGILRSSTSELGVFPYAPLAFFIAAMAAFVCRRDRETVAFIMCGFLSAGLVLGHVADSASRTTRLRAAFDHYRRAGEHHLFAPVEGRLRRDAMTGPSGVTLDVWIDRIVIDGVAQATAGGALVSVGGVPEVERVRQWRAGRRIALPASLRLPAQYWNAGVADTVRTLERRGSALVGSVKSAHLIDVTAVGTLHAELGSAIRAAVRTAISSTVAPWGERSAAVVTAILIGDRAGLDDEVERRLQEAGTYHVIAISGGNIAILAGLILVVLRAAQVGSRTAAAAVIVLLAAYAAVVEGGPSVARATLMAAIYFAAQLGDYRPAAMNVAALSAAVLICAAPLQVADAGLALTFGATIAILAGMTPLAERLPAAHSVRAPIALIAASACAEIALLPISAFVFSRVSVAGLVVNLIAIPLMTAVQVAGMCAVSLVDVAPSPARAMGWIAHAAVQGLIGSAGFVDWFPWLTRRVAPPAVWTMCAYYVALVLAVAPPRAWRRPSVRRSAALTTAACGGWMVIAPAATLESGLAPLRVTFLDVGQGDAAVVQFPNGRSLSVDAGGIASGAFDVGGRVVSPALWALGVRRLDYMTITHSDADHIGGAVTLFRDFRPFEVWEGVPVPPHAATRDLRQLAAQSGAAWRTVQPVDRTMFGEVELVVHHPPAPDWERQRVRNDDSQVIEIRHKGVSFVLTGDIGREVESRIASSFSRSPVRIVKVPHHGSATSSSQRFLDALHPDIAVISAGRGNPFGHPSTTVLDRYRRAGAAIYRTDLDGAVTIETDGTTVRVRTFAGRRLTLTTTAKARRP